MVGVLKHGDPVWVRNEDLCWVPGIVDSVLGQVGKKKKKPKKLYRHGKSSNESEDGNGVVNVRVGVEVNSQHGGRIETVDIKSGCEVRQVEYVDELVNVDNLTSLAAITEPAMLATLHERYIQDQIHTYSGQVLLIMNPFKRLRNMYGKETVNLYKNERDTEPLPPHVYSMAARAYNGLDEKENQTILVSGESGAGKTETTKILMNSLTEMGVGESGVENSMAQKVLESNPILEAFGNACTIRNGNSSRFGKLIKMKFEEKRLVGASITNYLLEKARIVHQGVDERNYHIIYAMAGGGSAEDLESWGMSEGLDFRYVCEKNGEITKYDRRRYADVLDAMMVLGFSGSEVRGVLKIVAGIMHLGNIEFQETNKNGVCEISRTERSIESCSLACELLQLDPDALEHALCTRVISVKGPAGLFQQKREEESFEKRMSCQESDFARDALAMSIYEHLFLWIVSRINEDIEKVGKAAEPNSVVEIGILDVFGFEVFEENGFEQLCINWCNERLQELFNEYMFKRDQEEYNREEIDWAFIQFPDNKACVELIENRPIGLVALLNENCLVPKGNDESLCNKMYTYLPENFEPFKKPSRHEKANLRFTIRHFAGDVTYSAAGFTRKNRNQLSQQAVDLVNSSSHRVLKQLLPKQAASAAEVSGRKLRPATLFGSKEKVQQTTVTSHFKAQLGYALDGIRSSKSHFIRCIKSNDEMNPGVVDRPRLINQLQYSGVLQIVKVVHAGYPYRVKIADFLSRYSVLCRLVTPQNAREAFETLDTSALSKLCYRVGQSAGTKRGKNFQVGLTKVFFRAKVYTRMNQARSKARTHYAIKLQRAVRAHRAHQHMSKMALVIQRIVRRLLAVNAVKRQRILLKKLLRDKRSQAACVIQLAFLRWMHEKKSKRIEAIKAARALKKTSQTDRVVRSEIPKRVTFDLAQNDVFEIPHKSDDSGFQGTSLVLETKEEEESVSESEDEAQKTGENEHQPPPQPSHQQKMKEQQLQQTKHKQHPKKRGAITEDQAPADVEISKMIGLGAGVAFFVLCSFFFALGDVDSIAPYFGSALSAIWVYTNIYLKF